MPRLAGLDVPGVLCHVMIRGKEYPKMIHIQNSVSNDKYYQEEFYKSYKWIDEKDFEIAPEHIDNQIGNYQIDIEFYSDESYKERLIDSSIRCYFRFCPLSIDNSQIMILPSENGHDEFYLRIIPLTDEKLEIKCTNLELKIKTVNNKTIIYLKPVF